MNACNKKNIFGLFFFKCKHKNAKIISIISKTCVNSKRMQEYFFYFFLYDRVSHMQDLVVIKKIYFLNDEDYVITNNMDKNQTKLIVH